MKHYRKLAFLLIILFLVCLTPSELSAQCAMCKEAASSSLKSNPTGMARSLNSGILYLMAVPYLMILFIFRKQLMRIAMHVFGKFSKKQA
jgi:hypothetical protein